MLIGEYKHNIDAKGRIIIPNKLREKMGDQFIITRGLDGCLFVYPMQNWKELSSKLQNNLPLGKKDARAISRFFYSAATEVEFDKQGRIVVPNVLREYAQLTKNCRIIGAVERLEIWDENKWVSYLQQTESQVDKLTENMADFEF